MTKAELVAQVADRLGLERVAVAAVVDETLAVVNEALVAKESIYLRGHGTYHIKHRAAKPARNLKLKTTITVPAHDIPAFKPSKQLIEQINK